jgi:hypothetical protein
MTKVFLLQEKVACPLFTSYLDKKVAYPFFSDEADPNNAKKWQLLFPLKSAFCQPAFTFIKAKCSEPA